MRNRKFIWCGLSDVKGQMHTTMLPDESIMSRYFPLTFTISYIRSSTLFSYNPAPAATLGVEIRMAQL